MIQIEQHQQCSGVGTNWCHSDEGRPQPLQRLLITQIILLHYSVMKFFLLVVRIFNALRILFEYYVDVHYLYEVNVAFISYMFGI